MFNIGLPPCFVFIQNLTGAKGGNLHPVAFELGRNVNNSSKSSSCRSADGGHLIRAMLGKKADNIFVLNAEYPVSCSRALCNLLAEGERIYMDFCGCTFWTFAAMGHPSPLNDEVKLDRKHILIGIVMCILGLLCFTLIPFKLMT